MNTQYNTVKYFLQQNLKNSSARPEISEFSQCEALSNEMKKTIILLFFLYFKLDVYYKIILHVIANLSPKGDKI